MKKSTETARMSTFRPIDRRVLLGLWAFAALVSIVDMRPAQAQQLNESLNEQVVMVTKKSGLFSTELETTIYKPDGEGPFPIVVINHGKAFGDSRFQPRYRPGAAVRYFMSRGYVVVVPMRRGFSKSSGSYIGGGCNVESNGLAQAEDVKDVLDYVTAQPYADKAQILVAGQSHGGWATLAFGTFNYPGVRGLVNFAGGLRNEGCAGWQSTLGRAAGGYGEISRSPSLWFYGDNDSYFSVTTYSDMFKRYTAAGGNARLVAFGVFGTDSHGMFGAQDGQRIWQPELTVFLKEVDLPSRPRPEFAKYRSSAASAPALQPPSASTQQDDSHTN